MLGFIGLELPPRIADTEECAHRACFRMADVTVIHSVVINATGSTATETAVFVELIAIPFDCGPAKLGLLFSVTEEVSVSCMEDAGESVVGSDA
jgi:hypothetical protein